MHRGDWLVLWVVVAALVFPGAALAQDDEEEDVLIIEEEPADVDNLQIYRSFKEELRGLPIEEELDAWYRYLGKYENSPYTKEIERRIEELETQMMDEAEEDAPSYISQDESGRGARYEEMAFVEPIGFLTNNTRKKVHLGLAYGYDSTFNYGFGLEWAFKRNFSVFGHAMHQGYGIGIVANVGAKYAIVKDTRTGGLLVVGAALKVGADPAMRIGVDPFIGIGVNKQGSPVTFQFQVGYDARFTPWSWDLHFGANLGLRASDKVTIYIEGTGHNTIRKMLAWDAPAGEECGDEGSGDDHCTTEYFGFYQGAAGVKIFPKENIEVSVGLQAPFFYRKWQHYHPLGGGASVMVYF